MLSGKVAVITGGSSGIGRAIAVEFAKRGANTIIADIEKKPRSNTQPTHKFIRQTTDSEAVYDYCDVSDVQSIRDTVSLTDEFGGLDIMVNNAGIARMEDFLSISEEEYSEIMNINTKGVFFGSQIAAKKMIENGSKGSIINISSIAGIRGTGSMIVYSASKGAVRTMTYALADKLGEHGIRANALHPGTVQTDLSKDIGVSNTDKSEEFRSTTPLGRLGVPQDVANAAVFLASDLSEFVSGSSIPVDGGRTYTY
jgi:NAD(P)-dependent dehydrogenase (short-subunit alcohol dehydrogenase family)